MEQSVSYVVAAGIGRDGLKQDMWRFPELGYRPHGSISIAALRSPEGDEALWFAQAMVTYDDQPETADSGGHAAA